MLRHLCYVGTHISIQCDDTLANAIHVFVTCDDTPTLCYDTSVTWAGRRNLVTQKNFVKFQDSRNFHVFQGDERLVNPKNNIFEKILKLGNDLGKVHLK